MRAERDGMPHINRWKDPKPTWNAARKEDSKHPK